MAANTVTTAQVASWGILNGHIDPASSVVSGIVTSVDLTNEQVAADEHNELGQVIGHAIYDTKKSGRIGFMVSSAELKKAIAIFGTGGASAPTKKTLTLDSETYNISSAEVVESNQDYMKVNLSVETWMKGDVAYSVTGAAS
jgi:hypothetical protein